MDHSTTSNLASHSLTGGAARRSHEFLHWIVRWVLFFLVCAGLGYTAIERYDPRTTPALSDTALYYRLVAGEEVQARDMRFRILVPYVARPVYLLARRLFDPARSVYLGLLIANSMFCATTACLLVSAGIRVTANLAVALLASALYLLNFAITNLQLAGMIDAGEACFIMAVTATLFVDRWWPLSLWGLFGALAKETFVPLAGIFAIVWWLSAQRKQKDRWPKLMWVATMVGVGILAIVFSRLSIIANFNHPGISVVAGGFAGGDILSVRNPGPGYFSRLVTVLSSRSFWYVFIWLLPLGMVGLRRLPRAWVFASILSGVAALALGLEKNIGGNVARPIFDVMGPLLSLSTAMLLVGCSKSVNSGL